MNNLIKWVEFCQVNDNTPKIQHGNSYLIDKNGQIETAKYVEPTLLKGDYGHGHRRNITETEHIGLQVF